jgi:penicillin-binding protein 1C
VAGQDAEEAVVRRAGALLGFLPAFALAVGFWFCLPSRLFDVPYSTVLLDREGRLLGASIAADGQWRFPADRELPPRFVQALIIREDRRFFRHPGVDPLAIARALVLNMRRGEVVSGASTITMQVFRLARGNRPRTLAEKVVEAVLALRLSLSGGIPTPCPGRNARRSRYCPTARASCTRAGIGRRSSSGGTGCSTSSPGAA